MIIPLSSEDREQSRVRGRKALQLQLSRDCEIVYLNKDVFQEKTPNTFSSHQTIQIKSATGTAHSPIITSEKMAASRQLTSCSRKSIMKASRTVRKKAEEPSPEREKIEVSNKIHSN